MHFIKYISLRYWPLMAIKRSRRAILSTKSSEKWYEFSRKVHLNFPIFRVCKVIMFRFELHDGVISPIIHIVKVIKINEGIEGVSIVISYGKNKTLEPDENFPIHSQHPQFHAWPLMCPREYNISDSVI